MQDPNSHKWEFDESDTVKSYHDKNGVFYDSDVFLMHGFHWFLRYYANCQNRGFTDVYVELVRFPTDISQITVKRTVSIKGEQYAYIHTLDYKKDQVHTWGIKKQSCAKKDSSTRGSKHVITIKIQVLNVLDVNGKDMTLKYLNKNQVNDNEQKMQNIQESIPINNEQLEMHAVRLDSMAIQIENIMKNVTTIQNTLKDMQLQINEEQKDGNNELKKEIDEIKKNMKLLLSNNSGNDIDKDKQEFKNWIEVKLKLPQYYEVFVENGIETLNVVQLMTKDELNEMGINKIGHKIQILKEIQKLQKNANEQPQEGGTAYI